jgi:hypothetical protein
MKVESIMAMYANDYVGDAALIRHISPEETFRSIVERMVLRKEGLVNFFGLDDEGRRFFSGTPVPLEEVAGGLKGGDLASKAWAALRSDVLSMVEYQDVDDKIRDLWRPWLSATSWSYHDALVDALRDGDTLMFTDERSNRRIRFGKALSVFDKERLNERKYRAFLDGLWREPSASTIDLVGIVLDNLKRAQKPSFMLSVNPYDIFLMSSDCPWDSCHKPTGLYPGAAWQYMNDSFTAVLLHLPASHGEFPWRKLGRVLVHAQRGAFFLGRGYGSLSGNDLLGRNAATAMTTFLDEEVGHEPGHWRGATNVYVGTNIQGRRSAYGDCSFLAAYKRSPEHDPDRNTEDFIRYDMPTFWCGDTFCPECGDEYQREDTYERKRACMSCTGDELDAECDRCSDRCDSNNTITTGDGQTICEECFNRFYRHCPNCDEAHESRHFRTVRTGSRRDDYDSQCGSCTDNMDDCTGCGSLIIEGDERTLRTVQAHLHWRADGTRVRRPVVVDATLCEYCYDNNDGIEECQECYVAHTTSTSSFPALIELQTMDGPRSMCRDCARGSYDCIHADGKHWTPEALGEHRLDEMLAMIFANESPVIRNAIEEVGL